MSSRIKNDRQGKHSVLVVCEGENTEPAYFFEFEKFLLKSYSDKYPNGIKFKILPFPPEERKSLLENQEFSRVKKKQELKNFATLINDDIEEGFFAEPVRWVRFAQKQAEGGGYNQIWSVFDYDNRNDDQLKRAFDQSLEPINGTDEKVNIAYSSYSFEYWLLLHYECCDFYIAGSECRDGDDKIDCGTTGNVHSDNCNGAECLGGYLRSKSYEVGFYNKSEKSTFPEIVNMVDCARNNSLYVREHPKNSGLEVWKIKPVTTMHILIDKLTKEDLFRIWHYEIGKVSLQNFDLVVIREGKNISIEVVRKVNITIVIPMGKIKIYSKEYREFPINIRVQITSEEKFNLPQINIEEIGFDPKYASVEIERKVNLVEILKK